MGSPLEIQIGLHYYCCADEFDPERIDAPAVQSALKWFVETGLLEKLDNPNPYGATYKSTHGLDVWCNALTNVPFPVRKWVIPSPGAADE
ncbi:hypothetical protein ACWX0K_20575 [Nitrobacteraceae bacterium UC4446_H13]